MFKKGDYIRRIGGIGIVYKILELREYVDLHQENMTVLFRIDNGKVVKIPTLFINHSGYESISERELELAKLLSL